MKLLITGANGFVGRALGAELHHQGYEVIAAVRSVNSLVDNFKSVIVNAIDSETDWSIVLSNVDVVVHLAARVHVMKETVVDPLAEFRKVNVEGTLSLAQQAAEAGVKRFIFISSVKVNGEQTEVGKPFTESDIPNPQDAYGVSKHEAEQGLLEIANKTNMEIVIIRPPLVYGAGVKANFANMLKIIKRRIPLPLGSIRNKRSFVYVGNLVSLISCCLNHPAAANQTFLVSDGQDLSTTELLHTCAKALGVKITLLPIPQKVIEYGAILLGKRAVAQRLCGNLQVDISKAGALLGWKPPFSVEEGLKVTALGLTK